MKYKENWEETKQRFEAWWNREDTGRPLMRVVSRRKEPIERLESIELCRTPEELHLDVERRVKELRNYCHSHIMMAESFPSLDINIGPGSMALYLGCEPTFIWDTVWFQPCIKDNWNQWGKLSANPDNYWWKRHLDLVKQAHVLADGDFLINIPDIIENIDILAAMRGPQELCYDLMDEPEMIKDYINQIDELYFEYYNQMYDIVKGKDGSSSYTAFNIWGYGKTAKVQCDFSALISPKQFREFIQESLRKQCQQLDHSLYHLDGPDAIKHLDALMEIEELDAVQWTSGDGHPDGGKECWYPIYDKVRAADKGLWVSLYDGNFSDWVQSADRLVKRYGSRALYLLFPDMEENEAIELMTIAEKEWR